MDAMTDVDPFAQGLGPLEHREAARRRAQLALYGERHGPGVGYLADAASELVRGALVGGSVLAAGVSLGLGGPTTIALFTVVLCGYAIAEAWAAARASALQINFYRKEIQREPKEM